MKAAVSMVNLLVGQLAQANEMINDMNSRVLFLERIYADDDSDDESREHEKEINSSSGAKIYVSKLPPENLESSKGNIPARPVRKPPPAPTEPQDEPDKIEEDDVEALVCRIKDQLIERRAKQYTEMGELAKKVNIFHLEEEEKLYDPDKLKQVEENYQQIKHQMEDAFVRNANKTFLLVSKVKKVKELEEKVKECKELPENVLNQYGSLIKSIQVPLDKNAGDKADLLLHRATKKRSSSLEINFRGAQKANAGPISDLQSYEDAIRSAPAKLFKGLGESDEVKELKELKKLQKKLENEAREAEKQRLKGLEKENKEQLEKAIDGNNMENKKLAKLLGIDEPAGDLRSSQKDAKEKEKKKKEEVVIQASAQLLSQWGDYQVFFKTKKRWEPKKNKVKITLYTEVHNVRFSVGDTVPIKCVIDNKNKSISLRGVRVTLESSRGVPKSVMTNCRVPPGQSKTVNISWEVPGVILGLCHLSIMVKVDQSSRICATYQLNKEEGKFFFTSLNEEV